MLNKFGILAGCNRKKIIKHLTSHLKKNNKRINFKSPFGDKSVTKKIIKILKKKYARR